MSPTPLRAHMVVLFLFGSMTGVDAICSRSPHPNAGVGAPASPPASGASIGRMNIESETRDTGRQGESP